MPSFQKITVIIALVMLIICLIFVGVSLYNSKYHSEYPPVVGNCPDYWIDNNGVCDNVKSLGDCTKTSKDFSGDRWQGDKGLCNKYNWANNCQLTWDGITNATEDPCKDYYEDDES